jgi:outer membrane protein assembly factor BamA
MAIAALLIAVIAGTAAAEPNSLRLESVRVEPAGGQEEVLVLRHLPLHLGQIIDPEILVESRRYLREKGFFARIDVYTTRGTELGAVVLVVEAELDRRFRFETGVGSEPLRGWYLTIPGVRKSSPFGRGGLFRVGLRTGMRTGGPFAELEVPSIRGTDLDLLVELEIPSDEWEFIRDGLSYQQYIHRARLRTGLRKRTHESLSLTLWAGLSTAKPGKTLDGTEGNDDLPASTLMPEPGERDHYADLSFETLWDRRDRLRPWQAGYWAGLRLKASIEEDGPFFWGAEADYRTAYPLFETQALAFRAHAAVTAADTPYHLRHVVGGPRSLRGFASAGLSGPLGARALWLATGEWRVTVAGDDPRRPGVLCTFFTDTGQHWNASGTIDELSTSVGYGLQFAIPWLQVLNFEVAYPLSGGTSGNPVVLHASLGRSF